MGMVANKLHYSKTTVFAKEHNIREARNSHDSSVTPSTNVCKHKPLSPHVVLATKGH